MITNFRTRGITLLELAITLVILGILANLYFTFRDLHNSNDAITATQAKMQEMEKALITFIANNGRLPCPASPAQITSDSTFGKEQINLSASPASCIITGTSLLSGALQGEDLLYYGAVPTRTLGLPDDYMFDPWGNRIGYFVQRSFSNNHITNPSCIMGAAAQNNQSSNIYICFRGQASNAYNPGTLSLEIRDSYNGNVQNSMPVYALVSHGPNGYGAFRQTADLSIENGTTGLNTKRNAFPPLANTSERTNTSCNPLTANCADNLLNNRLIQAPPSKIFDDILHFKTRNQLVQDCNAYLMDSCTNNFDIYVN